MSVRAVIPTRRVTNGCLAAASVLRKGFLARQDSVPMQVRRFRPGDGPILRDLRLRALAEAPDAYSSTLSQESGRPLEAWEERALAGARADDQVGFFAFEAGRPVGMVRGYFDDEEGKPTSSISSPCGSTREPAAAAPAGRSPTPSSPGHASARARLVKLWVTTTNGPAVPLYERCGFRKTGAIEPLPSNPALTVARMEREP